MAVITLTPASVARVNGPKRLYTSGEAIVQGGQFYVKASDHLAYNAKCDGTAAEAEAKGTALTAASAAGKPFLGQEGGDLDVGTSDLVAGEVYCLSRTAGKMIAHSELVATDKCTVVGVAKSASRLSLLYRAAGVAVIADPAFSYAGSPFAWSNGVPIATAAVTSTGGAIQSFEDVGGLLLADTGLVLNTSTGAITGTPNATMTSREFVILARGARGRTGSATITVTIS